MNKNIRLFLFVIVGLSDSLLQSRYVSHTTMSAQEELVGGIRFKHIKKSINGKREELFQIDGSPVSKEEYDRRLEDAHLVDIRKERHRVDQQRQTYMEFTDQVHTAILEKLAKNMLNDVCERIERLHNEILKPYLVFDDYGIKSSYQLAEMKHYVQQQLKDLYELVQEHDTEGLQEICDKIEAWPEYLETCFKESVQNAIKQSDDTSVLKELLACVSE